MRNRTVLLGLLVVVVLAIPAAALAQSGNKDKSGVLFRAGGDVAVAEGERADAVIVIEGDLAVAGMAGTAVVVNGTAALTGATVDTLVVVNGDAVLGDGSTVTGDVVLFSSTLEQSDDSTIGGSVVEGFEGGFIAGLWIFALILAVGFAIVAIVAALVFAAVAPVTARATGRVIMADLGAVVLAGLAFWIGLPIAAGLILVTIVGIPIALTIWLMVMPLVGFLGFLAAGIWIGDLIVARGRGVGHPYLAAFVGTLLLGLVGLVPFFGGLVVGLASLLGGSALALLAWRSFRSDPTTSAAQVAVDEGGGASGPGDAHDAGP